MHSSRTANHDVPAAGRSRARSSGVVAIVAALALIAAGCSNSSTSSSSGAASPSAAATSTAATSASGTKSSAPASYPAGKEQVCEARDQLKTSLAALTNPALLLGGTAGIQAAVKQVQTDLDAVAAAGKQDYAPQVTAVQKALTQLETAVTNLGNGGGTENLTAVGTAIAATGTAAGALFTQLQTGCQS
jgi:hypothetical protein